jgi:tRNA A-37 threonylcarbamoyl transferase component Bud32
MNNLPDFSAYGYQVRRSLGHNAAGGRVVYQALSDNQQMVVIKQFQFAKGVGWSGFKSIERETQVLRGLDHVGIPHYLESFETEDGFCIVQEYKNAQPLSASSSWNAEQVKQIAIKALEILVYLQNRFPPIIHRDLKPENILVDDQLNVYLIDFGFARMGGGEVALSSVAAGTFGFMALEQLRNRELDTATDLYGLGATLICLLTGIRSTNIDTLIDDDGLINFRLLVPHLSFEFITWLEKMVAARRKDRYPSAKIALAALKPLPVLCSQSVRSLVRSRKFLYLLLPLMLGTSALAGFAMDFTVLWAGRATGGVAVGVGAAAVWFLAWIFANHGVWSWIGATGIFWLIAVSWATAWAAVVRRVTVDMAANVTGLGVVAVALTAAIAVLFVQASARRGMKQSRAIFLSFLTSGFGLCLGAWYVR